MSAITLRGIALRPSYYNLDSNETNTITLRGIALQSLNYIVDNGVIIPSKVYSNIDISNKTNNAITLRGVKGEDNINITSKNGGMVL